MAASTPPLGTTTVLTNAMVNTISADVLHAVGVAMRSGDDVAPAESL